MGRGCAGGEAEVKIAGSGPARHHARPRRPMAGHQLPEVAERQPPVPLQAHVREDIRAMGRPRPPRAEERIYVEPGGP